MAPVTRPPRTEGHRQRDTLLADFAAAGLSPVLSTNGSIPEADIQIVKGPQHGEVIEAWLTSKGKQRLNDEWVMDARRALEAARG